MKKNEMHVIVTIQRFLSTLENNMKHLIQNYHARTMMLLVNTYLMNPFILVFGIHGCLSRMETQTLFLLQNAHLYRKYFHVEPITRPFQLLDILPHPAKGPETRRAPKATKAALGKGSSRQLVSSPGLEGSLKFPLVHRMRLIVGSSYIANGGIRNEIRTNISSKTTQ